MADMKIPVIPEQLNLNRRQVFATAATLTVAAISPTTARAASVESTQAARNGIGHLQPPLQIGAWKPGRGNACRLREIAKRNLLRREAGLPLLSIPKELRRMKEADDAAELEQFRQVHDAAIREEIGWQPRRFSESLAYNYDYECTLRERFRAAARNDSRNA